MPGSSACPPGQDTEAASALSSSVKESLRSALSVLGVSHEDGIASDPEDTTLVLGLEAEDLREVVSRCRGVRPPHCLVLRRGSRKGCYETRGRTSSYGTCEMPPSAQESRSPHLAQGAML